MAQTHPESHAQGNAPDRDRRFAPPQAHARPGKPASVLELLGPDDPLHDEVENLLANNHQTKPTSPRAAGHPVTGNGTAPAEPLPLSESEELAVLRAENTQLRTRLEELEQILEATTNQTEQLWAEQQKEYEMLLEEKSEVIRNLHQQLHELKEKPTSDAGGEGAAAPLGNDNSLAMRNELLELKEQLERERRQLEEDEQSFMDHMRQMELALSRERVEMARQRGELQRLYHDFQHEIEQAQKDGGLRERLMTLQRRSQQEATPLGQSPQRPQPAPGPGAANGQSPPARRALPTQAVLPGANGEGKPGRPSSGFIRRLFG
jgi:hypothetical protein